MLLLTGTIVVDADNVELTDYPFKVRRAFDMASADDPNVKYEGFMIEMDVDPRDVLGREGSEGVKAIPPFNFVHRVYRDEETIVTAPLLTWSERNDIDEQVNNLKKMDARKTLKLKTSDGNAPDCEDHKPIYEALNDSVNKYVDRHKKADGSGGEDWQTAKRHFILKFPAGVRLSGEVLACNKGKKDQELKSLGQMYQVDIKKISNSSKFVVSKLYWMVADLNQRQRKIGKLSAAELADQTDAAAAMMESLGIS